MNVRFKILLESILRAERVSGDLKKIVDSIVEGLRSNEYFLIDEVAFTDFCGVILGEVSRGEIDAVICSLEEADPRRICRL